MYHKYLDNFRIIFTKVQYLLNPLPFGQTNYNSTVFSTHSAFSLFGLSLSLVQP